MAMDRQQPDPHDVPGFDRATGVDDTTPRAEYRDEPPEHEPQTEHRNRHLDADDLRHAAAEELRDAARHVEAGDYDDAEQAAFAARSLVDDAKLAEREGRK